MLLSKPWGASSKRTKTPEKVSSLTDQTDQRHLNKPKTRFDVNNYSI